MANQDPDNDATRPREYRSPWAVNAAPVPPADPGDPVQPVRTEIPKSAHLPGLILLAAIWAAWLWHLPGGMLDWGLSGAALAAGQYQNIALHMFAHAGLMHIGFNSVVLFSLAGPLFTRMGMYPASWLRFYTFYFLSGLAGAGLYLALHPAGTIPMVGASGAISGLIGLVARLSSEHDGLVPLFSAELGRRVWGFVKANLILILLITVPIALMGGAGGIAWEAHLGGFLVGLLCAKLFVVRRRG